jgi:hypothetical protein
LAKVCANHCQWTTTQVNSTDCTWSWHSLNRG